MLCSCAPGDPTKIERLSPSVVGPTGGAKSRWVVVALSSTIQPRLDVVGAETPVRSDHADFQGGDRPFLRHLANAIVGAFEPCREILSRPEGALFLGFLRSSLCAPFLAKTSTAVRRQKISP